MSSALRGPRALPGRFDPATMGAARRVIRVAGPRCKRAATRRPPEKRSASASRDSRVTSGERARKYRVGRSSRGPGSGRCSGFVYACGLRQSSVRAMREHRCVAAARGAKQAGDTTGRAGTSKMAPRSSPPRRRPSGHTRCGDCANPLVSLLLRAPDRHPTGERRNRFQRPAIQAVPDLSRQAKNPWEPSRRRPLWRSVAGGPRRRHAAARVPAIVTE
jgi:hypothetical protein